MIMFPELFQKIVLGKYFDKVRKWTFEIPIEDFIMFFIHFDNNKLLTEYFISRLENL